MGEKSDAKLIYSLDGKGWTQLQPVNAQPNPPEQLETTPLNDYVSHVFGGDLTIRISRKQSRRLMEIIIPREFKNNWRKLHGIPMRRKKR
ncbi:MAG: hypothetical protein E7215_17155 [Clostridium sulfidigenes]|uniref:Uncharacterized protein n=1 Tax=Clostridium sulfidigenes TaxID=318464 RepID=A0A927W763_9CLOT|nr:hypothetical protein [Clostridium sulfidigenes]